MEHKSDREREKGSDFKENIFDFAKGLAELVDEIDQKKVKNKTNFPKS